MPSELPDIDVVPLLQDDMRLDPLSQKLIRDPHDADLKNARVGKQQILHLLGSDLLPAPIDLVLGTSCHLQVGPNHPHDVPGPVEPLPGEGLGIVFGGGQIAADRVGATGQQMS